MLMVPSQSIHIFCEEKSDNFRRMQQKSRKTLQWLFVINHGLPNKSIMQSVS